MSEKVSTSTRRKAAKAVFARTPSAQSLATIGMDFDSLPSDVTAEIISLVDTVIEVLDKDGAIK